VLLVLDQPILAEVVRLTLAHGGFEVGEAASAADALLALGDWSPHAVVLDMGLEGVDGARLLARIGSGAPGGAIPVIALIRRGDLRTKLEAFARGVDDILIVTFAPEELLARVVALVRRAYRGPAAITPVVRVGELEVDILHRTVRVGAAELHLTALELSLLYLLVANAGRALSRDEILDALWGRDYVVESNVVDRQVRRLRARLRDNWRRPRFIETVPGQGYRFLPVFRPAMGADPGSPGGVGTTASADCG
jgi:DNA-binding response OmpR family regulator